MKVLFELEKDERTVGIVNFRDAIILATDRRIYRLENIDDDKLLRVEIVGQVPL